ncbi:hypothetical protein PHJA_001018400 [Phtheirospermum japonicum]|uniref:Uncharacterized protein n=1 Tax=Phtheirospermum japonicum TaxID=374723 RepID=A0A830BMG3_9LAMI|nr:hypothetical protein PHJA_001018400 [Phtheirospermum japonicum]
MSMSIFSAFEALCAETFYGQKVALPLTPPPSINIKKQDLAVKIEDLKKGKEVNSQPEDRRRIRAPPRFAPELDGVYCFETILPY